MHNLAGLQVTIDEKIRTGRGAPVRELTRLMSLPSVASTTGLQRIVTDICKQEFPSSNIDFNQLNQCDSSEFLVALLDCLKSEFKLTDRGEFEQMFEGRIQQKDTCNGCEYQTTRSEQFMISSFPFKATLTECINTYFCSNQFNAKSCQECPSKQCKRTETVT